MHFEHIYRCMKIMSANLAAGWESSAASGTDSSYNTGSYRDNLNGPLGDNGCTTASNSTATETAAAAAAAVVVDSAPAIEWVWDVDASVSGRVATDASWVQDMLLHLLTNAKQVSTALCAELCACCSKHVVIAAQCIVGSS
jgi:hypothetical protein